MKQSLKDFFRPNYITIRKLLTKRISLMEFAYFKTVYFSQFGEDAFVDLFFSGKRDGFYVDVGAFHPFLISNTYAFYKKGWQGINIEPNPASFRAFPKYRPRDINLNIAVGAENREVLFNCIDELSGIDGDTHLFRDHQRRTAQCWVRAMPLASIFKEHIPKGITVDFLSVDCEGHDEEVLRSNDWDIFRPRILLVEDHQQKKENSMEEFLLSVGYKFVQRLGLTAIFILEHTKSKI